MGWTPWGAVGDALDAVWDVLDDVPGFDLLGDGVKAIATGPLRDFARTSVGQTVFRAMATAAMATTGGLTAGLGPYQVFAMASAAALPGMARGDSFEESLLTENLWRIEETIKSGGGEVLAASLPPQWQAGLTEIKARAGAAFGDLPIPDAAKALAAQAGLDPEEYARRLAAELGIREDMAVQAMEMAARLNLMVQEAYDIDTGAKIGAPSAAGALAIQRLIARTTVSNRSPYIDIMFPPKPEPMIAKLATQRVTMRPAFLALASPSGATAPALERTAPPSRDAPASPGYGVALALVAAAVGAAWYVSRR